MPPYQPARTMGSTNRMSGAASANAGCNNHRSSATTATDTIANPYLVPIRRVEFDMVLLLTPTQVLSPAYAPSNNANAVPSRLSGAAHKLRVFVSLS